MWYTWIVHPSEKLWPFEFLHSFCCSISCISICEAPESDIRVKSYDHLNSFIASVVQFLASRYVKGLNRTSDWKVMTIWISRELPLFNYEHLDILRAWVGPPCEKLWPFRSLWYPKEVTAPAPIAKERLNWTKGSSSSGIWKWRKNRVKAKHENQHELNM